jgi:hypothetical protein
MRVKRLRKASRTCNVVKSCASTALAERSTVAIQEECRNFGRSEISECGAAI